MSVQSLAGVFSLISGVHSCEGQYTTSYHSSGTHSVPWTSCNNHSYTLSLRDAGWTFAHAGADQSQMNEVSSSTRQYQTQSKVEFKLVVPIHSMAGVGFPVTVQRNSARWPCWTFSTEGVTVARGWIASAATEGDTAVIIIDTQNGHFPEVYRAIKCDNADCLCGDEVEQNSSGVYNPCLGLCVCILCKLWECWI